MIPFIFYLDWVLCAQFAGLCWAQAKGLYAEIVGERFVFSCSPSHTTNIFGGFHEHTTTILPPA